jgi:hypothetical protein
MTSLRLKRAISLRWRQLLITPLSPKCKGQCVQSIVLTQVGANSVAAVRKRRHLRPPMSDEVTDGLIETVMKICFYRHPYPDQRPLRPLKLLLTKSTIFPAAKVGHGRRWSHWNHQLTIRIYRHPRGFWGHQHHCDTHTLFPTKSIGLIEPLLLGVVVIYKIVILSQGRLYMTYTLSIVQKKIIYRLIRPMLNNVVISKQALDTSWGIPNFLQSRALKGQ